MGSILDFAERRDILGYISPQYAIDVDPRGFVISKSVASRLESLATKDKESIYEWVRFAGRYPFNSRPWREIAKAVIRSAKDLEGRAKQAVFVELLPKEIKSSSYPAGEMDPRPEQDLLARKRELQEETNPDLIPFRKWHLAMAQAQFDQALARYKEENET